MKSLPTAAYSKNAAIEIDAEIRRMFQDSCRRARDLFTTNLCLLHQVAAVPRVRSQARHDPCL